MPVSVGTFLLTLSIAIMQVPTSVAIMQVLRFYCNYVGGTSGTLILVGLFLSVTKVTVSIAINAVRSFCNTYAGEDFCSIYMGDNFY